MVERAVATYNRALRALREAMRAGDARTAKSSLQQMRDCVEAVEPWRKSRWLTEMIEMAAELGDAKLVRTLIESVPAKSRSDLLGFDLYARIGMKPEAVAGAVQEIKDRLTELNRMDDPNVHYPIHGITRALLRVDAEYRPALKKAGFVTRDPREKERRKYGLKKARKASQFSKR
jgi:hypothetical protein